MLRKALFALALAGLAVGLTACGAVNTSLSNPLALAADKSAKAGGVKMHLDASFSAAGQSTTLSADGAFDGDQGQVTLHAGDLLGGPGYGAAAAAATSRSSSPRRTAIRSCTSTPALSRA